MMENKHRLASASSMFERPQGEGTLDPKRFVFLSTEGFITERSYFKNLDSWLRRNKIQVQIHVLNHCNDGLSSPRQVLDLLNECKEIHEKGILPFDAIDEIRQHFDDDEIDKILNDDSSIPDEKRKLFKKILLKLGIDYDYRCYLKECNKHSDFFAVVLDRDKQSHEKEELEFVWEKCKENNFGFYISNPCFEFWLFLHLWDGSPLPEDEKERMLENAKVSNRNTYMSKFLSNLTHHSKRIGQNAFNKHYSDNIQKAIDNSSCFATDIPTILSELGTNLGKLIALCIDQHSNY